MSTNVRAYLAYLVYFMMFDFYFMLITVAFIRRAFWSWCSRDPFAWKILKRTWPLKSWVEAQFWMTLKGYFRMITHVFLYYKPMYVVSFGEIFWLQNMFPRSNFPFWLPNTFPRSNFLCFLPSSVSSCISDFIEPNNFPSIQGLNREIIFNMLMIIKLS